MESNQNLCVRSVLKRFCLLKLFTKLSAHALSQSLVRYSTERESESERETLNGTQSGRLVICVGFVLVWHFLIV